MYCKRSFLQSLIQLPLWINIVYLSIYDNNAMFVSLNYQHMMRSELSENVSSWTYSSET
jgi:hypothetical protein